MRRHRKSSITMSVYFVVCLLAMIWPGAVIANRIEPMVLGVPFVFFWYVLWVFLVLVGCLILYAVEYGTRSRSES